MPKADPPSRPGSPRPPGRGPDEHWFSPLAHHTRDTYLRYSFTKGTANEVDMLIDQLRVAPGDRLLDVGCGPGRHAHEFARRGFEVVGVDISADFIDAARVDAPTGASFVVADVRALPELGAFDAVYSLCQGGFGLPIDRPDDDELIMRELARQLRPGGRIAVSAFSAYFQVRFLDEPGAFDARRGINHERTTVLDGDGREATFDLWTRCYTPVELDLLATRAGLEVVDIWSVEPGRYAPNPPTVESPEFLLIARVAVADGS